MSRTVQRMSPSPLLMCKPLQRSCACGGASKAVGECESCNQPRLQRSTDAGSPASIDGYRIAPELTTGGAPLDSAIAARLGPLLGSDFRAVRVHRDTISAVAARQLGARAFTVGEHVHFGEGQWRPDQHDGLHLIAHELSHTLQQARANDSAEGVEIDAPDSPLERAADSAADAALAGRAARVTRASNRLLSRRLLQRAPNGTKANIGTAAGGSEAATLDRKVDDHSTVHINRTVTEAPCHKRAVKSVTPDDKIFYWDKDADAIGFRYSMCNGKVQLGTSAKIDYSEVVKSATGLLSGLQNDPKLGANLGTLLQSRIDTAQLKSSGDITLSYDGVLQAGIEGSSTVGTTSQQASLQGKLKITPGGGLVFIITGGVEAQRTPLQKSTSYKATVKAGTETVVVSLSYEQIDQTSIGGPSSSSQTFNGGVGVKIPIINSRVGPTVTVGPDMKPAFGVGMSFDLDRTPVAKVDCYECDCPPPKPEYRCTREVQAHTVVDAPADDRAVRLTYQYNQATPAKEEDFSAGLDSISGLVKAGYGVTRIWGYASPEGSLDAPKAGGAFKGNLALSQQRAEVARSRLQTVLPEVALPAAEGHGELLGSLGESADVPDRDITADLVSLLKDQSPEQRLETLGVSAQVLDDPKRRQQAIDDIQAFIDGREKKVSLAERPRWEKVFPFLRRVEVALHKDSKTHTEGDGLPKSESCAPEDLAYAKANLPALPAQRRIPKESCDAGASS